MMTTDPELQQVVRHKKSKGLYEIVAMGMMKFDGKWYDSVSYIGVGKANPVQFTRTREEFNKSFEAV